MVNLVGMRDRVGDGSEGLRVSERVSELNARWSEMRRPGMKGGARGKLRSLLVARARRVKRERERGWPLGLVGCSPDCSPGAMPDEAPPYANCSERSLEAFIF